MQLPLDSAYSTTSASCTRPCEFAMTGPAPKQAIYLEDDQDEDDVAETHKNDDFDRKYLDERSWETLTEDEHGRLIAANQTAVHRKRMRPTETGVRIRRGLMRCASICFHHFCVANMLLPAGARGMRALRKNSHIPCTLSDLFETNVCKSGRTQGAPGHTQPAAGTCSSSWTCQRCVHPRQT